ncbi:MAG: hypothetical protein J6O50_11095 [Ruminiclostridium sp.]|nr:hypothetical protein [Ruminiclostridium sp.]
MDIKEIVENAMYEAESKYPPSDIENALENVLKRAENTAPGAERAAVRANAATATNVRTGEHKIIKALAGIAAAAAVLAGAFFGLKYLSDNNIELLKEGGGSVTVTGTNEPAVTAAQVTKDEEITTSKTTALSDKITEINKKIAEKKAGIENAETEKNAYSKKAEDANNILNALAETLVNLRALDETPEILQEIKGIEADIDYYSEIKAAYDDQISVLEDHIDRLKQELSVLEQELLEAERSRDAETESTTETSAEITTNALLYDTAAEISASTFADTTLPESSAAVSSETTEPTEVSPTDDELKALVKQGAEACGLKITVSDLTRGSLNLHYTRDMNVENADKLAYNLSNRYEIQVWTGSTWQTYDPDNLKRWNDEQMWFDSLLGIGGEEYGKEEDDLILFYGNDMYESEIPDGHYRISKIAGVTSEVTGEHLGQLTAYAEFTIDEHTPNIFGITMTAKNVSPESVILAVQQSGVSFHVKRNLGYKARFVLERKTGSGEWKKVDGNPVTWGPDVEPLTENGVTEIKEDFSDIYGSLPDGTYRISKQFVNYVGTGETKDDILNSSTYYCEFVIGEKTHDWGITISAKDVTPAGMTLLIDQKGGNATGELTYGEPYSIECKNGDKWEPVKYLNNEVAWTDIGYILEPGAHNENQINWTYIYGYLPAGHYRLVKEFMDFRKTGDYDQCDFYMEFDVSEIDSKLGITLNTKRNTARWITLDAASIGDTVSEHMSFNENRYVIEQKKNGKWTEYYTTAVPGIPTPETARKINAGDVVTFTVDWRERAGSLPVGEYRIGLTFTGGSVSETIYAEFTVEDYMTNEFGLQIRPIELSRTGGRFAFESLGGDYNVRTLSDKEFSLQKQTAEGEWKTLSAAEGAVSRKSSSPTLTAFTGGGSSGIMGTIEWKELFGTLSAGHYRLGKKFSAVIDGKTKEIMIYCEFDITADTPEIISE